jgi:hypothetical protein
MDSVMRALAKKKTPWKEDLFFAVKLARQKLSKYTAEVTRTTGMLRISAHILDSFTKFRFCSKWDKGMHINPGNAPSYNTQYQEAFLKYGKKVFCAKHQRVQVNKLEIILSSNLVPSRTVSGSYQSSFDPYD